MAESMQQIPTLSLLVSQHADITHRVVIALQQKQNRRRRRSRQRKVKSCWGRNWLSRGQMIQNSQYYNLMENTTNWIFSKTFQEYNRNCLMSCSVVLEIESQNITRDTESYRDFLVLSYIYL